MTKDASLGTKDASLACPICSKPAHGFKFKPFCSARCADVDLHRWLGGVYRVETDETELNEEDGA